MISLRQDKEYAGQQPINRRIKMKVVEYTSPTGAAVRIEIEYSKQYKDIEHDLDGDIIIIREIVESQSTKVFINGELKAKDYAPTEVKEKSCNPSYANIPIGSVVVSGNGTFVCINGHTEEIMTAYREAIAEGTSEECKAEEKKEHQAEIERAKELISKAESQDKIMTKAECKEWIRNYNNLYNEGGEGYVPTLITKEQYESAKQLVARG
jgi:hypothetical protein